METMPDLSAVAVGALERALAENPAAEAARGELERRAGIDGEGGTEARAALTRLDEAAARDAAAQAATRTPERDAEKAATIRENANVLDKVLGIDTAETEDPEDVLRRYAGIIKRAGRTLATYHDRRRRLEALEVRDTQAARAAKLELDLGEAVEALDAIEAVLEEA